jgi:hypothetical protein
LGRIALLAEKAQRRIAECLVIQTRTGTYSPRRTLEQSPRIATLNWEG